MYNIVSVYISDLLWDGTGRGGWTDAPKGASDVLRRRRVPTGGRHSSIVMEEHPATQNLHCRDARKLEAHLGRVTPAVLFFYCHAPLARNTKTH